MEHLFSHCKSCNVRVVVEDVAFKPQVINVFVLLLSKGYPKVPHQDNSDMSKILLPSLFICCPQIPINTVLVLKYA